MDEKLFNTISEIGPWQAIATIGVCALAFFIFVSLRNFYRGGDGELKIIHERIDKINDKMDDMQKCLTEVRSSVAYLKGKMENK